MAQIPKGSLVKGPYTPICRDCAIYFSSTVNLWMNSMISSSLRHRTQPWISVTWPPGGRGKTPSLQKSDMSFARKFTKQKSMYIFWKGAMSDVEKGDVWCYVCLLECKIVLQSLMCLCLGLYDHEGLSPCLCIQSKKTLVWRNATHPPSRNTPFHCKVGLYQL